MKAIEQGVSRANLILLLLAVLVSACQPLPLDGAEAGAAWHYADLKLLDPIDSADAGTEIVAAYARLTRFDLEVRLDLLEYRRLPEKELGFRLDFGDGVTWMITSTPGDGAVQIQSSDGHTPALRPRILHDLELECVILRLNRVHLPGLADLQISAAYRQDGNLLDEIGPFGLQSTPPSRAPLILAFWNTLPAATPAQALRRWDGAHTGPYGQRHGLAVLLQAAQDAGGVPLALLDLKTPSSLAALNLLHSPLDLSAMERRGLLLLPLAVSGDPQAGEAALEYSRKAALNQGFQAGPFIYGALPVGEAANYPALFASLPDSAHLAVYRGQRLVPLPGDFSQAQAGTDGLSREVKSALLQTACSTDPTDVLVLGGSLPESPWADSSIAPLALRWLANHPWVQLLTGADLLQWPARALADFKCSDWMCQGEVDLATQGDPELYQAIQGMPAGNLKDAAWLGYLNLTRATNSPQLAQMQAAARQELWALPAAAEWAANPRPISDCQQDWDADGQRECILADETWFNWIELDGGRLAFSAIRTATGVFQVLGASSQVSLGLGEAAEWKPERGAAADPQVIPGAFADDEFPWAVYQAEAEPEQVRLSAAVRTDKIFHLEDGCLTLSRGSGSPGTLAIRIPLLVTPERGLMSGWEAMPYTTAAGQFTLQDGPLQLRVEGGSLSLQSAFDSSAFLSQREDPNTDYPAGHYLPFPLILIRAELPIRLTAGSGLR